MMRQTWAAIALLASLLLSGPAHAQGDPFLSIVSPAAESSRLICAARCRLQTLYMTSTSASASFLMVFDALTAPSNGAVTPKHCIPVPANSFASLSYELGVGEQFTTGAVAVMSSTGCFTLTAVASGYFKGRVMQQ